MTTPSLDATDALAVAAVRHSLEQQRDALARLHIRFADASAAVRPPSNDEWRGVARSAYESAVYDLRMTGARAAAALASAHSLTVQALDSLGAAGVR